ncbi:hypothetical protein HOV42_gp36 [Gordonia phage Fairfaxidum]|uniref:Uncharacterized protein n=1 Tax=Gordonia phage Fairfaxidum TaxID=2572526 RepID=A0A4D6T6F2_9CAUD|nr:hypothetical protein HOV42_gp36 [Gordonia phage Fairfaxidum]QCG77619.1 hypothetical protein SEA_FAIRFAXIDUM_36 [Gordonia phage Fairfaxidum]
MVVFYGFSVVEGGEPGVRSAWNFQNYGYDMITAARFPATIPIHVAVHVGRAAGDPDTFSFILATLDGHGKAINAPGIPPAIERLESWQPMENGLSFQRMTVIATIDLHCAKPDSYQIGLSMPGWQVPSLPLYVVSE